MSMARLSTEDNDREFKRSKKGALSVLGFSDKDKIGTIQPHDDTLRGLNLKPEDLTAYDSPLVSFEGKTVTTKGTDQIAHIDWFSRGRGGLHCGQRLFALHSHSGQTLAPRPRSRFFYTSQKVKYLLEGRVEEIQSTTSAIPVDEPAEEVKCKILERVIVDDDPEKFFQVGSELPLREKEELIGFLRENVDVFAWDAYEAPRVDPSFICHYLNVNPSSIPKKQPPRHLSKEHANAVRDEVTKLKKAGAIKEVFYPEWLANTVVDYHQIPLAPGDQEKTAFMTPIGNYHYKVIPFGLKNAGSTYQRMITRMFELQLGKSVEVYIDDMVIKSKVVSKHVRDHRVIFGILRKHKLRFNASKCSFSVGSGKFLGYMVTHRGIEQLKEYLSWPPIMSSPEADEVLFAYIVVAPHAVSLVLIQIDDGIQQPVYYVSKSLHEAEVRYLPLEKAILVVVHTTQKLPHYFQAHTVVVLTQLPLRSVLRSADYTGRIAMWSTLLGAFDIKYMPRTSVKGQVLADLIAEFAEPLIEAIAKKENMDGKSVGTIFAQRASRWKVYVDGAANQRRFGVGLVLISPEKITIEKSLRLGFSATNNEAEYETLLQGMAMV
ncbi:uncharacterized protein LOC115980302 [Quercus lobata]|uniref:uncharacterized protein LOC115980302 n=1 Tax=Quercus lobata TaxID=97700 RepID=UPI001244774A|nr:uncharacterized protein LOC115980302 [Quercus lobata]